MVRLKVVEEIKKWNKELDQKEFQFHYGTIKSLRCNLYWLIGIEFQFHYGTIKSIGRTFHFRFIVVFQFHYGTIKSWLWLREEFPEVTFQFHYGTIKRNPAYRNRIANSISIPLWYD